MTVILVKNEDRFLDRVLHNIADFCDRIIVADNGSNWYLCGAPDSRWNDDDLHELHRLRGRDFEAVYTGPIEH